jgi:hypothetical protein
MCYLVLFHISLFVVAILCFVKGIVLLLPFPLTVVTLVFVTLAIGIQGNLWDPQDLYHYEAAFFFIVLGITTTCLSLAFLIAMAGARDPEEIEKERRRRRDDWDDEWDDRY